MSPQQLAALIWPLSASLENFTCFSTHLTRDSRPAFSPPLPIPLNALHTHSISQEIYKLSKRYNWCKEASHLAFYPSTTSILQSFLSFHYHYLSLSFMLIALAFTPAETLLKAPFQVFWIPIWLLLWSSLPLHDALMTKKVISLFTIFLARH